jgi:asparagine synthase (glutamine-hydrolysing)
MCRIAGIYNKHGMPEDRAVIERMSLAIEHRGPDKEGFHLDNPVHLASRRLSILDLSGGKQTIYNKDHSRCIVYNGEIYNYQSLKKSCLPEVMSSKQTQIPRWCFWPMRNGKKNA